WSSAYAPFGASEDASSLRSWNWTLRSLGEGRFRGPLPGLQRHHAHAGPGRARHLVSDHLTAHARLVAKGEHDGPDHRHQQHHAGRLEEVDVLGVEHPPDRL